MEKEYDMYISNGIRILPNIAHCGRNIIIKCKKGLCNLCNNSTIVLETDSSCSLILPQIETEDEYVIYDNNSRYDENGNIKMDFGCVNKKELPTVEDLANEDSTEYGPVSLCQKCISKLFEEGITKDSST